MATTILRLAVVGGPDTGALFDIDADGGPVGRAAGSAVKLTDPAVSRVHGRLAVEDGMLVWREAEARNPALINGVAAEGRRVRAGDEIVIGRTRLVALAPGGGAVLDERASRITAEVSAADLGGRRGRQDLLALIALGDAMMAARDRVAAATAAAAVLREHLRATRVDVVAASPRLEPIATVEGDAGAGAPLRLSRAIVERALAGGTAIHIDDGEQPALVAAFAPADATTIAPGFLHVARGAAFSGGELELAVAAARLVGSFLASRGAHDTALRKNRALEERIGAPRILGGSPATEAIRAFVAKVAPAEATVLLLGESGTGKELVASAIHHASPRAAGPFVAVNCAALTDTLLESELFGHERGAFTGAADRKPGRFELADGGTLLLDEVGELPLRSQAKLLRVLEDRRVERVGGVRPIQVDVRIIAATNRDLEAMVRQGHFREDLYFRLSVIQTRLPALRERPDDVPVIAEHFLAALRSRGATATRGFAPDAIDAMRLHAWPGNVRELRNAVERAVVLGGGDRVTAADLLPPAVVAAVAATPRSIKDAERATIVAALAAAGGNKMKAAAALGIDRTTLYKKLRAYGL